MFCVAFDNTQFSIIIINNCVFVKFIYSFNAKFIYLKIWRSEEIWASCKLCAAATQSSAAGADQIVESFNDSIVENFKNICTSYKYSFILMIIITTLR